MNVLELKSDLHHLIDKINDKSILNAVRTILSKQAEKSTDWWDMANEEDKKAIKEGLEQLDKGDFLTRSQVRGKIKEKYNF
ncbi:MAG: hypothetical protein PHD06_02930 [Bacteroidales bacterium]|jgi:predicted transcriptional regulator|nr:hypothetical protein [Bacteroidales bacterium]MDD4384112.1 hypothetical protein [Bacteroidales bacterium]MDY0197197.1 hypothetical protein [Tenuifilaceae bacterium]